MSDLSARGVTYYGMLVVPDATQPPSDYLHGIATHEFDGIELEAARRHLVPGAHRALVAGAGLGGTAAMLALHLGVENVVCYEPHPGHADLIRQHVRVRNAPLLLVQAALSAASGDGTFYVSTDGWPSSSLHRDWAMGAATPVPIPVHGVMDVVRQHGLNALVLDLEGEERAIIPAVDWSAIAVAVFEMHGDPAELDALTRYISSQGLALVFESGTQAIHTSAFARLG